MDAAGDDKIVELTTLKTEAGAQIQFRRLEGLAKASLDTFPAERERNLLNILDAELAVDIDNNELVVRLNEDTNKKE